jgi:adenine deaminase
MGEAAADLAVVNGSILNVYTGEILTGDCILCKKDKIAYTGKYAKRGIDSTTRIIDAAGKFLIPGFIDGHTHMDYLYSSREIARFGIKTGTTTIITEAAEIAFRLGYRGIVEYLKSTMDQPIKFWFTLPPMGTISPISQDHRLTLRETRQLLKRGDCVGLGETYWGAVNAGDPYQLLMISETLKVGKKVEGHSAGATANKLQAYMAMGVTSDHEPITEEEALERLRLGLSVMVREGEVRHDLEAVSRIKDRKIDFRRLAVSTDGVGPWELTKNGFMDHLVRRAVELGFSPVEAVRMATLNVAEHFNLQDVIGGIAPGRYADIIMVPDLTDIRPELVISIGQVVMQDGKLLVNARCHSYPAIFKDAIKIDRDLKPADFSVPVRNPGSHQKVRIIDQVTKILTRDFFEDLPVVNGQVRMLPAEDIIKVAAVEYRHSNGKVFTGFIKGTGLKRGAVGASTCWDSADILVAGANESDMALTVNRIKELNGGAVVCCDGKVVAEVAFPIGSVISDEPMESLAKQLTLLQEAAQRLGCVSDDIRTTLSVLPTPAIPYLRICESGLFSVKNNEKVELFIG